MAIFSLKHHRDYKCQLLTNALIAIALVTCTSPAVHASAELTFWEKVILFDVSSTNMKTGTGKKLGPGPPKRRERLKPVNIDLGSVELSKKAYFSKLSETDWNYNTRADLRGEAVQLYNALSKSGNIFHDPVLTDFLLTRVQYIIPGGLPKERWANIRIAILDDPNPNAHAMEDGTIFISTGLLSVLHNIDELDAVLAHEIAHISLDHNLRNFKTKTRNKKIGAVLGTIAGVAAATYVGHQATKNSYSSHYDPSYYRAVGALAATAGMGAFALTNAITDMIGAKYSRQQEVIADSVAVLWLNSQGKPNGALSRALARIKIWQDSHHIEVNRSFSDSHPLLASRIDSSVYFDESFTQHDFTYSQSIVRALVNTASYELANNSPRLALELLNRATNSITPTSLALALKANALRKVGNTPTNKMQEIVSQALTLDPNNILALTESVLLSIRNGENSEADAILERIHAHFDTPPPWILDLRQSLKQ